MKTYYFLIFVVLTLAVNTAIAIECYDCSFTDGVDNIPEADDSAKSCQSGKKPSSQFSKTCLGDEDSCVKFVFEEGQHKATVRDCWVKHRSEFVGLKSDGCYEAAGFQLKAFGLNISDSVTSTFCTCTGDKCNSSSTLKITQGSLIVLVVGFIISKFMY